MRHSIVEALAGVEKAEFAHVRALAEITDSAVPKQVTRLEEAGWMTVEKGQVGRRPRTWLCLTEEVLAVYRRHVAALTAIVGPESPCRSPRRQVTADIGSSGDTEGTSPAMGRVMTMVKPPPGESSAVGVSPMGSVKPRATARPTPARDASKGLRSGCGASGRDRRRLPSARVPQRTAVRTE
ncbi:transcriptional regulator [Streptomyces goshikiensis]|uniref:transcriptional regulator n=1 Tax=Streptomyces goshikiensis TaxID=1942 RepID=UPI0036B72429